MILLTVDWDFFWNEDPNFDWGHREGGDLWETVIWAAREVSAQTVGQNLRELMVRGIEPPPEHFWKRLMHNQGLNPRKALLTISDSHMHAAVPFCEQLNREYDPVHREILSFDAHHDFCYPDRGTRSYASTRKGWNRGRVDAGNWMGFLVSQFRCSSTVVYPDWKGRKAEPIPRVSGVDLLSTFTYQEYSSVFIGTVDAIHIARSPVWSPPWGDERFVAFVKEAEKITGQAAEVVGDRDPREVRPYNFQSTSIPDLNTLLKKSGQT